MSDAAQELDQAVTEHLEGASRVMAPIGWFGGKGLHAKRLVPHIPWSRVYCEPYCGAASVFWHLQPRPVEVLNDLNGEIIALFRCLQDRALFEELRHRLLWTPYSRAEFCRALETPADAPLLDRAWATFVKYNQGTCGVGQTPGNWGRVFTAANGMANVASKWRVRLRLLKAWHDRLTRVQLDNRDALEVIRYWDTPDTFFYVDPPYVPETRSSTQVYRCEATADHHRDLVALLLTLRGGAAVSGYDHPIYRPLEDAGWERHEFETVCHAAARTRTSALQGKGALEARVPRTEVVWVKPLKTGGLFPL